jgi:hypothetical protein
VIGCECPFFLLGVVSHPALPTVLATLMTGASGAWGVRSLKSHLFFNAVTLKDLRQRWLKSWMCLRCGAIYS